MRLRKHLRTAQEELVALLNDGYDAISEMETAYRLKKEAGTYDDSIDSKDRTDLVAPVEAWADRVLKSLDGIFPTPLERHLFGDPEIPFGVVGGDHNYQRLLTRCRYFVRGLNKIRLQSLPEYTDLPLDARLYIEHIDSFSKVRDVNPAEVTKMLKDGYLDRSEDSIQLALERILNVPVHKKDWSGEQNDLYTTNLLINGMRHATAFLLKGNGLKSRTMEIKHCGVNGDQIGRLCQSAATLFVVQFVGQISEAIVSDIDGKVRLARTQGKEALYCIIDGQDTARLLLAYGEPHPV